MAAVVVNPFTGRWIMEPKRQNIWGIPHSLWFTAMGVGGALFINRVLFGVEMGRVLNMTVADWLGMILIAIGGLILIGDLGRPFRVLRAFSRPRTSWISRGAIADFIFLIVAFLWTIADAVPSLPWHGNSPLGVIFQIVAAAAAFVVIIYPALVLASSPSIPFWNTTVMPMHFLAYAFASALGLGLLSTLWAPVNPATLQQWARAEVLLIGISLVMLLAHLLNGRYTHVAGQVAVSHLLEGDQKGAFIWGTLVVGLIVPAVLVLLALAGGQPQPAVLGIAGLIAVFGNWLSKLTIIRAGTYAPFL